jgi:hypothetical protein
MLGGGTSETLRDLMGKHIMASDVAEGLFGYDMMALRQA